MTYIDSARWMMSLNCKVNKVDLIIYIIKELPLSQTPLLGFKVYYPSVTLQSLFPLNSLSYTVLEMY